ncbi:helix-turn-helix domain-containing protein [Lysinibacillus pakistanensis]|uniref:Helix-turn-helix domain-containing protein n=1 Tax=Lysinibacillus pakistanensis TaxID=759811 RepID=A0AAX3WZB1_9BACI|nr:helix-turn-helix domain-containing protein [Lysinibacillus pakistanensis]MDM5231442.1 helix-turn-helix domain-containing protein [Lysinibacillus pakistanensis]WHY46989.1 helix-turn-helix domain-containing protein [Lysinibacillus pakistanensis]WHY52001.1 helix-turn-helix domain-containing protein [Lysinibacillus pakistanensis]
MEKITLTVKEAAKFIGVSATTVYTMVRQNEIPYKKVRGSILFHRPTIEHWLTTDTNGGETK